MLLEDTPVEEHYIGNYTVYVKREDMFGQHPAPPLAKLRGARHVLFDLKRNGIKSVGVFDTRISKAGQGIAYLCKELGMECMVGFPMLKNGEMAESHKIALELGARLMPMKAGRTAVCYHQCAKRVKENGGHMLPLGLVCKETVTDVAKEAERTLEMMRRNGVDIQTIVLCTGTGTIATGVALGSRIKVVGVSCGMSTLKQWKRMKGLAYPERLNSDLVKLIDSRYDYYYALNTENCPFPTSPYYDMKAWEWLCNNIDTLDHPVMFWNIGV